MGRCKCAVRWTLVVGLSIGWVACGETDNPREATDGVAGSGGDPVSSAGSPGMAGEPGEPGGAGAVEPDGGAPGGEGGGAGAPFNPCGPNAEVVLAVEDPTVTLDPIDHFTIDSPNVYWTSGDGTVMQAAFGGGEQSVLAAQQDGGEIAVDALYVYWCNGEGLSRALISGGDVEVLTTRDDFAGAYACGSLRLGPTHAYFRAGTGIQRIPSAGGTIEFMAQDSDPPFVDFVLTETHLFYELNQEVWGMSLADRSPYLIAAAELGMVGAIAADDTAVYWIEGLHLMTAPVAGGAPVGLQTLPGGEPVGPDWLAVADGQLYWFDGQGNHEFRSLPTGGGGAVTLWDRPDDMDSLSPGLVQDGHFYWEASALGPETPEGAVPLELICRLPL